MSGTPWFKFYASDWRSDPRLRMCGMAARGLWMEMICLMHEATPYGHLLVSGRSPTDMQLAVLAGAPSDQIPELLGELETAGVFSRTKEGVIYSRKMTRMQKKAATARRNGSKGGNPSLSKERDNQESDNQTDKVCHKPQKPDTRNQSIGSGDGTRARQEVEIIDQVDEFEEVVTAAGVDLSKDITGKWHGSEQKWVVSRWRSLGLSQAEILTEVRNIQRKRTGPPGSLKYFDTAMQRAAGRKKAPPLEAIQPAAAQGARYDQPTRETRDERVIRLALEMRRTREVDRASGIE